MSLLSSVLGQLAPSMKSADASTYRQLARETGAYERSFEGYQPYLGDHEPPSETTREPRARIVYDRTLAAEDERTSAIAAYLEGQGLKPSGDPKDWDAIGDWIYDSVEGSREPGSDRYSPRVPGFVGGRPPTTVRGESTTEPRPVWRSIAFDLGLALGRRQIGLHPGGRWIRDGERPGREGSVSGEPLVAYDNLDGYKAPFGTVLGHVKHALLIRLGLMEPERRKLGDALRTDDERAPSPAAKEPDEFIAHLRQYIAENGAAPDRAEIGALLADHGLDDLPDLPADLAALLDAEKAG